MNIEISVEHDDWNQLDVNTITNESIERTFGALGICSDAIEICVLFTNDSEIQALNKTFRGIDAPTNVLSFPATPIEDCTDHLQCDCEEHDCILGSMAIAYETMLREAVEQEKSLSDHLHHLIVHSTLHLIGYDHMTQNEAEEMEQIEIKILKGLNIRDPYQ